MKLIFYIVNILIIFGYTSVIAQDIYEKQIDEIYNKATNGDVDSQSKLGRLYYDIEDYKSSLKWYEMAANNGDLQSQFMSGTMYKDGKYIDKNCEKALTYLEKSANKDFILSQLELSKMYENGICVEKDKKKHKYYI